MISNLPGLRVVQVDAGLGALGSRSGGGDIRTSPR